MSQGIQKKPCDCSYCKRQNLMINDFLTGQQQNKGEESKNNYQQQYQSESKYEDNSYKIPSEQEKPKPSNIYQSNNFGEVQNDKVDEVFQKDQSNLNQNHNINNDLQMIVDWINQFPNLRAVQNKMQAKHTFMQEFVINYSTCDQSLQDISFHFKPDGSQAIFFSIFCQPEILQKTVAKRDDIAKLYYDSEGFSILLVINPKIDYQNYDQMQQEFDSNQVPLEIFISQKFEEQQKIFRRIGLANKGQVKRFNLIKNARLRIDLDELFGCLDDQFDFDYSSCSDHCFAYYTQSENLNQLEGLIIGPQDTPYEGLPYTVTITIPDQYPIEAPKVKFNQQILHPNISEQGEICLNILQDKWNTVLTIQKVLVSIVSLLYEKNLDDVYNHYAKTLYQEDPLGYRELIRKQSILQKSQNLKIDFKTLIRNECKHSQLEYQYENNNYDDQDDYYEYNSDLDEETEM
ncbi:hypothetical protein ABPG72_006629 [Tetrahymena utriculariae]